MFQPQRPDEPPAWSLRQTSTRGNLAVGNGGAAPGMMPNVKREPKIIQYDIAKKTVNFAPDIHFPMRPFMGIMAVAPAKAISSRAPGLYGGNMDFEKLQAVPLLGRLWFVLVCPPVGMATADVYRALTVPAQPQSGAGILAALRQGDPEEIGRQLHNRLQPVAERLCRQRLGPIQPPGNCFTWLRSIRFAFSSPCRKCMREWRGTGVRYR